MVSSIQNNTDTSSDDGISDIGGDYRDDFFRVVGDMLHMASILVILHQLLRKKNGRKISNTTQEMFCVSSILLWMSSSDFNHHHRYNTIVFSLFVFGTGIVCQILRYPTSLSLPSSSSPTSPQGTSSLVRRLEETIDLDTDSERYWATFTIPCLIFSILVTTMNDGDFLYTLGTMIDALAMIPQILIIYHNRLRMDKFMKVYIILVWLVQPMNILHWMIQGLFPWDHVRYFVIFVAVITKNLIISLPWILEWWISTPSPSLASMSSSIVNNNNDIGASVDESDDDQMMYFSLMHRQGED